MAKVYILSIRAKTIHSPITNFISHKTTNTKRCVLNSLWKIKFSAVLLISRMSTWGLVSRTEALYHWKQFTSLCVLATTCSLQFAWKSYTAACVCKIQKSKTRSPWQKAPHSSNTSTCTASNTAIVFQLSHLQSTAIVFHDFNKK